MVFLHFSSIPTRPQRPVPKGKMDGRKSNASKASSAGNKNAKKTGPVPSSSRKKPGATSSGDNLNGLNKDEENKEEEPPEEEKKFEAQNHMEGDLVDILGKY